MKNKYIKLSVFIIICFAFCSCSISSYYTRGLFKREYPLKVTENDNNKTSGYSMIMKICKSSYGKPVMDYIDKNGLPEYYYIPTSPLSPSLIYIKKNICTNFVNNGFLIFPKIQFQNEEKISLYLYDYFDEYDRNILHNLIIDEKKQKVNEIRKKGK